MAIKRLLRRLNKDDFNTYIDDVKKLYEDLYDENERLRAENERLKSEAYKDEELASMQDELNKAIEARKQAWADANRGFPISEAEDNAISQWISEHEKKHGATDDQPRYTGAIGGAYTYEFVPTSIGVLGQVVCGTCNEKFVFQELF